MGKSWKQSRDDSGSMLATVIVIVGGAGLCCFLTMLGPTSFSDIAVPSVLGVALLMIAWIAWYRYGRNSAPSLKIVHSIQSNPNDDGIAAQYRPRKIKGKGEERPTGTLEPITADEAHQIQVTSANTWVPSKATADEKTNDKR